MFIHCLSESIGIFEKDTFAVILFALFPYYNEGPGGTAIKNIFQSSLVHFGKFEVRSLVCSSTESPAYYVRLLSCLASSPVIFCRDNRFGHKYNIVFEINPYLYNTLVGIVSVPPSDKHYDGSPYLISRLLDLYLATNSKHRNVFEWSIYTDLQSSIDDFII